MSLGVVAGGHEVTVAAAEDVLRAGGNAYDAILAALAASCVCEPVLSSLGGGGFLMAAPAGSKPVIYDFFSQIPQKTRPVNEMDFYAIDADFGEVTQEFHIGMASSSVPGVVKGMFDVHQDLCSLPMKEIFAPAVKAAKEGVVTNAYQSYLFGVVQATFKAGAECKAIYGSKAKGDALVQEGEVLKNPELADFMEVLASEGVDLFYKGEPAQRLDRDMREGGLLTLEDLKDYEVVKREPLELHYHDAYIEINPPPAAGGILIAFGLKLLEKAGLKDLKPGSQGYLMVLADALDKTLHARADLEAGGKSVNCLLDENYLALYREQILERKLSTRGTTHISVIDKDKNMASLTVSNGEGCGYVIPGTGIVMNNMLGEEDLNPHGFHAGEPGSRLSSMMTPTTIVWPDGRRVATGSGGSNRIRTALLQLIINLIDHEMSIGEAVNAPRIHFENDRLDIEGGFSDDLNDLMQAYPQHNLWNDRNMFFGGTHTVGYDKNGFSGAGDPRRSGVCRIL